MGLQQVLCVLHRLQSWQAISASKGQKLSAASWQASQCASPKVLTSTSEDGRMTREGHNPFRNSCGLPWQLRPTVNETRPCRTNSGGGTPLG